MGLGSLRRVVVSVAALIGAAALAVVPAAPAAEVAPPPPAFHGTWSDNMSLIAQQGRSSSVSRLDDVKAAGVGLIRQYVWWDRIERQDGTYDWAVMDQLVADANERDVAILPTLLYPPSWHTPSKPAGAGSLYPPDDPDALATFATAMVERYGPHGTFWGCREVPVVGWRCDRTPEPITMWEVWNEPDYPAWWKGAPDPADYLPYLQATHDAIKAADPTALVVLGSLTNSGSAYEGRYLDQLYALGGGDYFDVLAMNPYAHDVGALMAFVKGSRAIAAQHGDGDVPILLTEYGWATGGNSPYIVVDEGCQAALLHAATSQLVQRRGDLGVIGAIQFQWHDVPTTAQSWPHYAGVRRADGTDKPGRAALTAANLGQPAPAGHTLAESCPPERRSLDGELHQLTVEKTGVGTGTVRSSPSWLVCEGSTCSSQVQPAPITVSAKPDPGSYVVGWRGADCSGALCVLDMDRSRTVEVEFGQLAGTGVHQENSPLVSYSGEWQTVTSTRDRAGASRRAGTGPASATLGFQGTGVRWISRRTPSSGKNAVYIDGQQVTVVDRYARPAQYGRRVYDSGPLGPGDHTVTITHTGTRNRRAVDDNVWLDAFVVY